MSYASRVKDSVFSWDDRGNLVVENAVIFWTNFKGEPTKFNPQGGKRTFNIAFNKDIADELSQAGWNIKMRDPYDEDDDPLYFTECVLNMNSKYMPKVYICSEWEGKKTMRRLYDDNVGQLDEIRSSNIDVVIHPHEHDNGAYRCKGYCNTLIVTMAKSNLFGSKYSDYAVDEGIGTPDSGDDDLPF